VFVATVVVGVARAVAFEASPRACAVSTVLIADNDPAVSSLLRDVLVRAGLTVQQAFDGEMARQRVWHPDVRVVVCDLDMPKVPGIEVLESMADLASPPAVVVVSGFVDEAIRQRLGRLAFVRAVLRKPFDLLAFASTVRDLVGAGSSGPGASQH